jgi:NitT/TauT family transport system ATP-binding protein
MLELKNISFSYGEKKVLDRFSFQLKKGEIIAIMGPSGCGKSTLLHILAGLQKPSEGTILSTASKTATVFQEPRLLPWMTVAQNICAVLPRGFVGAEARIAEALRTVELSDSADLYPDELSGGMKSRASLARALAYGGDLYLLDEPTSALDEDMSLALMQRLREKFKREESSAILVTHRRADAEAMADRIIQL